LKLRHVTLHGHDEVLSEFIAGTEPRHRDLGSFRELLQAGAR
jgi:hypothetical protein